jgi:hypothetical protein
MYDFEDTETVNDAEADEDHSLILDGTANVEYSGDEQVPHVMGLLELIREYFRD